MTRRNGGLALALVVGTITLAVGTQSAVAQTTIFSSPSNAPVSSYSLNPPIVLKEEGSLNAGAQVLKNAGADGGEFHHDYLQANYGVPVNAHKNSLIMWHGCLDSLGAQAQRQGPGLQGAHAAT